MMTLLIFRNETKFFHGYVNKSLECNLYVYLMGITESYIYNDYEIFEESSVIGIIIV